MFLSTCLAQAFTKSTRIVSLIWKKVLESRDPQTSGSVISFAIHSTTPQCFEQACKASRLSGKALCMSVRTKKRLIDFAWLSEHFEVKYRESSILSCSGFWDCSRFMIFNFYVSGPKWNVLCGFTCRIHTSPPPPTHTHTNLAKKPTSHWRLSGPISPPPRQHCLRIQHCILSTYTLEFIEWHQTTK
jgi:hypothetical protein